MATSPVAAPVARASRAVFLDAGGVLQLPDHARVVETLRRAGIAASVRDLDRAHYVAIAAMDQDSNDSGWRAYQLAYAREIGVPEDRLDAAAAAVDAALGDPETWRRPVIGARPAMRLLSRLGALLVIVSNADGTVARRLAEGRVCQVGPGSGVEVVEVLDSAVVGVAKPDAGIFELALRAAGLPAERVLHVGDSVRFDVRGAEAAGVRAVHFDPLGLCVDPSHEHVRALRALPALLD